jgi:probable HAF family extracellular repeat protein
MLAAAAPSHAEDRYAIRPLAAVADQVDVFAKGINNLGQVVGFTVDGHGQSHATLWEGEMAIPLPALSSQNPYSEAYRINEDGQIAGKATTDAGHSRAAYWDADGIVDIGTLPGGTNSFAMDINASGVVAGSSEAEIGQSAFTWTRTGGLVDYGNTDPPFRLAVAGFNGLNNHGLFVGTIYILLDPFHAALAREGERGVVDISPPGRFSVGMALAVNDAGTIVGYQGEEPNFPEAAIFHGDGTYTRLGNLGLEESWAEDVNELGTIVGRAFGIVGGELVQKAFVYEDRQMRDLLTLVPDDSGWQELFEAAAINDAGTIAGTGIYRGEIRAFLATPVPEPEGFALVLFAVAGLNGMSRAAASRRRRIECHFDGYPENIVDSSRR